METLILILQLIILIVLLRILSNQVKLREKLHQMDIRTRVRQGNIAKQRTSVKNPAVERPRTIRRDTDDLPLTGRMSQGVHRKKTNASNTDDTGL